MWVLRYTNVGTSLNSETTFLDQADTLTDTFEWKCMHLDCSIGRSAMAMAEDCNG